MSISRNKLYFINFSRTTSRIFSSAIDCFLEIWFRHISRIFTPTIRIYILGLLEQAEKQYLMLIESSYNINSGIGIVNPSSSMNMAQALNSTRLDIWEYFKLHCPSFRRMYCNAQLSELFQKSVYSPVEHLSVTEYKILFSSNCHSGYSFYCEQEISINNEVLVNYITLEEMLHSGTPLD